MGFLQTYCSFSRSHENVPYTAFAIGIFLYTPNHRRCAPCVRCLNCLRFFRFLVALCVCECLRFRCATSHVIECFYFWGRHGICLRATLLNSCCSNSHKLFPQPTDAASVNTTISSMYFRFLSVKSK